MTMAKKKNVLPLSQHQQHFDSQEQQQQHPKPYNGIQYAHQPLSVTVPRGPPELPLLSSLLDGRFSIKAGQDVSWLLNFAIVGFPKCGTTSLLYQLQQRHDQVDIFTDERCDLSYNKQALLVQDLYQNFVAVRNDSLRQSSSSPNTSITRGSRSNNNSSNYRNRFRGLKCPADLESTAMSLQRYQQFFPHTKFIVGIRHPILWFESFYNFRIHNGFPMPPPEQLVGRCRKGMYNCCTFRSNFHIFLANLGKTQIHRQSTNNSNATDNVSWMLDVEELQWMAPDFQRSVKPQTGHLNRPVFLYDVSQLRPDVNHPERSQKFLSDLQHFLGLSHPFVSTNIPPKDGSTSPTNATSTLLLPQQSLSEPTIIWYKPGKKRGIDQGALERQAQLDAKKINICESPRFDALRQVLLEQAQNASHWIVHYFLRIAPNVTVSSRNYLIDTILNQEWKRDPCTGAAPASGTTTTHRGMA